MFRPLEDLTVHQPGGVLDGKTQYTTVRGRGRLIERLVTVPGPEGLTRAEYTVLVAPPLVPAKDSHIEIGGRKFRVGAVKICRDLDGRLIACRCEVVQ